MVKFRPALSRRSSFQFISLGARFTWRQLETSKNAASRPVALAFAFSWCSLSRRINSSELSISNIIPTITTSPQRSWWNWELDHGCPQHKTSWRGYHTWNQIVIWCSANTYMYVNIYIYIYIYIYMHIYIYILIYVYTAPAILLSGSVVNGPTVTCLSLVDLEPVDVFIRNCEAHPCQTYLRGTSWDTAHQHEKVVEACNPTSGLSKVEDSMIMMSTCQVSTHYDRENESQWSYSRSWVTPSVLSHHLQVKIVNAMLQVHV